MQQDGCSELRSQTLAQSEVLDRDRIALEPNEPREQDPKVHTLLTTPFSAHWQTLSSGGLAQWNFVVDSS
jgi:hypothetical protein